jgi:DNA-binding response OmpR family regulator
LRRPRTAESAHGDRKEARPSTTGIVFLLKEVWGPSYAKETHYLRVYLAQLRRKLEVDPSHPRHLITEAGMGYRFQE